MNDELLKDLVFFSSVTPILAKWQLLFFKEGSFSELPFFVSKIFHKQISCFSNYSFMFERGLNYWEIILGLSVFLCIHKTSFSF